MRWFSGFGGLGLRLYRDVRAQRLCLLGSSDSFCGWFDL